ncbi:MAG: hypothetical protein R3222_01635 [Balneolaceae bacterium]|nr:hypothetical protein [Balneolaceae bacterium]
MTAQLNVAGENSRVFVYARLFILLPFPYLPMVTTEAIDFPVVTSDSSNL